MLYGLLATTAHAQNSAPTANKAPESDVSTVGSDTNQIVVSATRLRGAVASDIPPETSINLAALTALDATDLGEVFTLLAPELGTGAGGQTLVVLVNGQRVAGFSTVKDVPPDAVSRIEVFPEQVALQYGYGPNQRVVNVVLRRDYHALLVLGRETIEPESWRWVYEAKVDYTRINAKAHWNLDIDFQHEGAVYAATTLSGPATLTNPATPASPAGTSTTGTPLYTLVPQRDEFTLSGFYNRNIGAVNTEFAGHLDLKTLQSRLGLADQDGELLASQGLPGLISGPQGRVDRSIDAQTSVTLNGRMNAWRWSFIGALDATTRQTRTGVGAGVGAGDTLLASGFDAVSLPSPALLGQHCDAQSALVACVSTDTQRANGDAYLNGDLFALPAGQVTAAFRFGAAVSEIEAHSADGSGTRDRSRDEGNAQANLDFPITARDSRFGKLSLGVHGELRQLSDFGTLSTVGTSAEWAPTKRAEFIASFSRQEQAPDLLQLGAATLVTPDVREEDFVPGNTDLVSRTEGGNGALITATNDIARFRAQVSPIPAADFVLSAEYTIQRAHNPIIALTAATSAAEAAFPDRFTRTGTGYLTTMDIGAVNAARRDQQQLRWGINWTTGFGAPWGPPIEPGGSPRRAQFQIALYHTWRLQDAVVLQDGQPALDLLGHDIINDTGGTARHQVEVQTTLAMRQFSLALNGAWQSPTVATPDDPVPAYCLTFSNGVTLNVKLQLHLQELRWLTSLFPHVKGTIRLSADNVLSAHLNVHDAGGAVPPAYSTAYLHPTGTTIRITVRKVFR